MSIVDMNKISILALKENKDEILDRLIHLGCMEITDEIDTPLKTEEAESILDMAGSEESFELDNDITNINSVIGHLEEYDSRKKGMLYFGQEIEEEDFDRARKKIPEIRKVADEILSYDRELSTLRSRQNTAENTINSLRPWIDYEIPLSIKGTRHVSIIAGTLPANFDIEEIKTVLYSENGHVRLDVVNKDKDEYYLVLLTHKRDEEKAVDVLKRYGFGRISVKESSSNAKEHITLLEKEIDELEKERKKVKRKISRLSEHIGDIEIYHDYLLMEKEKILVHKELRSTESTILIEGWIPKVQKENINEEIGNRFTCIIKTLEPSKKEDRPILLRNRGISQATELVTEMYSLPNHNEIDPNRFMAPFYIVFFGIMLGDAGYGIIVTAIAALLLWKIKLREGMKKVMKLLLFCGISTFICGILFGSIFGDAVSVLSGKPINTALLFDPILLPEKMLILSLALGVFQIFTGLALKGWNMIKNGRIFDAILDTVSWYLFFGGAVMSVLPLLPSINVEAVQPYVKPGSLLFFIGAALLLTLQGRHSKGIGKIFGGLPKMYDLIGFLSDVLSYSRLLSLGLASAVIAQVINQIGTMMGLDSVLGIVFFIVVFLAGHIFNLLLGTLSAYVHSSRLQYMEFFSKFYKGGGRPFEPFKIKTEYTNYIKNTNRRQG